MENLENKITEQTNEQELEFDKTLLSLEQSIGLFEETYKDGNDRNCYAKFGGIDLFKLLKMIGQSQTEEIKLVRKEILKRLYMAIAQYKPNDSIDEEARTKGLKAVEDLKSIFEI
ncbi:hypothetical protein KAI52_02010 [Candidatus Parcubacteria bacterium]|nr:hypothetical protein [Candidatus Parcubacteria bacterium]